LRELVQASGFRWASNAADRGSFGQPLFDQNTARFAIERLALGVLMPDESELDVIPGAGDTLAPAVPLNIESRDRQRRMGQLAAIIRTVCDLRARLSTPDTIAGWRKRLVRTLDQLTETSESARWLRADVDRALDDMMVIGQTLGDMVVERSALLRWIQGTFEVPQHGDRPITGAVQVCAMEPMRSVPFRVIALLGMNDKAFPRGGHARMWDPMEQRKPGERDRRETDRHLMLEAILSARNHLLLLWSGEDVTQGKEQPAAVPVEELMETLGKLTGTSREALISKHPLQPWSAGNFGASPQTFDHGMALAARQLRRIEVGDEHAGALGLASSGTQALPTEERLPNTLPVEELANALLQPHRLLLKDRLGLSVSYEAALVQDREPLELVDLERRGLRERMVDHLLSTSYSMTDQAFVEAFRDRLAGEGTLPMRAGGRAILAAELKKSHQLITNLNAGGGDPIDDQALSLQLEGCPHLVGHLQSVVAKGELRLAQWGTVSAEPNERMKLNAWLHLLVARASGMPVSGARLVGVNSEANSKHIGGVFLSVNESPDEAATVLRGLIELWKTAREKPLPLFRYTSSAIGRVLSKSGHDRTRLRAAAASGWHGGYNTRGDIDDRWIAAFFLDYNPVDALDDSDSHGLTALAAQVWQPVDAAVAAGAPLGAALHETGQP
jgi:exodeoxyribonuclease V gamma subunit